MPPQTKEGIAVARPLEHRLVQLIGAAVHGILGPRPVLQTRKQAWRGGPRLQSTGPEGEGTRIHTQFLPSLR